MKKKKFIQYLELTGKMIDKIEIEFKSDLQIT